MRPSMGTVGDAYDNAMAESFFSTLECELLNEGAVAYPGFPSKVFCYSDPNGAYLSTIWLLYRAAIASEARQSSRKATRNATLDSAQLVIPTGLQQSLRLLSRTSLK